MLTRSRGENPTTPRLLKLKHDAPCWLKKRNASFLFKTAGNLPQYYSTRTLKKEIDESKMQKKRKRAK